MMYYYPESLDDYMIKLIHISVLLQYTINLAGIMYILLKYLNLFQPQKGFCNKSAPAYSNLYKPIHIESMVFTGSVTSKRVTHTDDLS